LPDPSTIVCKLPHVGEGRARCHTRLTREALERMREAGTLAERMNDDRRRSRVSALMTKVHSLLGEVEEALASGLHPRHKLSRASVSLPGRARAVVLTTGNLALLLADWVYEDFGLAARRWHQQLHASIAKVLIERFPT